MVNIADTALAIPWPCGPLHFRRRSVRPETKTPDLVIGRGLFHAFRLPGKLRQAEPGPPARFAHHHQRNVQFNAMRGPFPR
jgi:hypothetical protein